MISLLMVSVALVVRNTIQERDEGVKMGHSLFMLIRNTFFSRCSMVGEVYQSKHTQPNTLTH